MRSVDDDDLPARIYRADEDPPVMIAELHGVVYGGDLVVQGEDSEERVTSSEWVYLDCAR